MYRGLIRMSNGLLAITTVGAVILLGPPKDAHAALQIALQQDGVNSGAITVVATAADFAQFGVSHSDNYGSFSVTIQAASSSNGLTLSFLQSSTNSIHNSTGTSATLRVYATQTN